jgi:hypothetical protein
VVKKSRETSFEDEDEFLRVANSTFYWLQSAHALDVCAEEIGEQHMKSISAAIVGGVRGDTTLDAIKHLAGSGQVFLMLGGLAIENLAKGLLIHSDKVKVTRGQITRADLLGHGAKDLLTRAGVTLSAKETEFVARLDKAVLWSGRYPMPTRAENFVVERAHGTLLSDLDDFRSLYQRVRSHFGAAVRIIPRAKRRAASEEEEPPGAGH